MVHFRSPRKTILAYRRLRYCMYYLILITEFSSESWCAKELFRLQISAIVQQYPGDSSIVESVTTSARGILSQPL